MSVLLPIRTYSLTNSRVHWRVRSQRAKQQRQAACLVAPKAALPCVVTMTRIGPRKLDDDNLQGALKSIRDGIADKLGVDDSDARIAWRYNQAIGKEFGVEIAVAPN